MGRRENLVRPDLYLLVTVLVLTTAGVMLVFDASYAKAADFESMNRNVYYLVKRQALFALLGLACMAIVSRFRFDWLKAITLPLLGLGYLLLIAVLAFGHTAHGATSWFRLGGFFVQPSELAKLALVLFLAGVLSKPRMFARGAPRRWLVPAFVCFGIILLVLAERDLGGAVLLGVVCLAMFFAAGAKKFSLIFTGLVAFLMVAGMMCVLPHCRARVRAWLDPWAYRYGEGYQTVHSLSGLGTGGLLGVGPCKGREKFYLPAASTDYVFSTLGEEAGLLGGMVLLGMFVFFTHRGIRIAHQSASCYGSLLATGVTALISIQAIINIAVVTSVIPATGLPLPFISYGGSSLVTALTAAGLLLAASRHVNIAGEENDSSESSTNRRRNRRTYLSSSKRSTGSSGYRSLHRTAVRG